MNITKFAVEKYYKILSKAFSLSDLTIDWIQLIVVVVMSVIVLIISTKFDADFKSNFDFDHGKCLSKNINFLNVFF